MLIFHNFKKRVYIQKKNSKQCKKRTEMCEVLFLWMNQALTNIF